MSDTPNINDSFFQGHYKEVWRRLIPPGLSEVECSFVEEVAALQPGSPVLDLMCGYGRHVLELARRGYPATAIDNLPDYIAEITAAADAENLPLTASVQSALDADFEEPFKAILCMGNSFAFFNRRDAVRLLEKTARLLQHDGVLIINTWMIAEIAIKHFQEKEWYQVGEYKYLLNYQYAFQPSRIESEHTIIIPDGSIETIYGVDYIFSLDEMETMLDLAGLRLQAVYSTPRKRLFKMGDNKAYLVIAKKS